MDQMEEYVSTLVERARNAQALIADYTQDQANRLCRIVARAVTTQEEKDIIANMVYDEVGYGDVESKRAKIDTRIKGTLWDILDKKSVGVIEEFPARGLVRIAKPVGVIAAMIPSTQPEVTPVIKALFALKGRNAIICSPHPSTKHSTLYVVNKMREALKKYGEPEDLIICIEAPTMAMSGELMRQCDLVVATGGTPLIKAAYSSGTPAFGAGAGNANVVIDETADIEATAELLINSKSFDQSSGCSGENSAIIHESVYDKMINSLTERGAVLLNGEQKELLQKALFPTWPKDHSLGRDVIMRPPEKIAEKAGFQVPEGTKLLLVEETGSGFEHPFSGEKLCPVLTIYKYREFDDAIEIVKSNLEYVGKGHSSGIHSYNEEHIQQFANALPVTRIAVRQAMTASNSGSWTSGNNWTSTLGCGTWGGNIVAENITYKHFINSTWISTPIKAHIPDEEELFGEFA